MGDLNLRERFALFLAYPEKCVWCGRPITFATFEVEHLIPRSLEGDERAEVLRLHGLPKTFDLESVENLAPSCRECNGRKGKRHPPQAPIIAMLLADAAHKAPGIRAAADGAMTKAKVENAFGVILAAAGHDEAGPALLETVQAGLDDVAAEVDRIQTVLRQHDAAAGGSGSEVEVALHPALSLLFQSGRWKASQRLSDNVVVVHDGQGLGGYVGTSWAFACPHCGSHGPWNGTCCMTCGMMSDPTD
ncbi:HNH endonuclease [Nocardioides sp.]|uniref:HNH endonuclease n=1 Tax=Nocardioides sp. TaxID=35761 RepID=UPI0025EAE0D6|nr:HNH endonuclease [Nocardioides sp.]